jgi:hypothetical protein
MKELDPFVFLAVFQEMLGPLLWVLVAIAAFGVAAFLVVVARERKLVLRRFIYAELVGFVGSITALLLMWGVTQSSLSDVGGPVDLVLVLSVFVAGWAGALVLFYGVAGLFSRSATA